MKPTERERNAYHEAGHTVAAVVYGVPILYVTVAEHDAHLQRGGYQQQLDLSVEALAVISLAGPAAERLFFGEAPASAIARDLQMAQNFLAKRYGTLETLHQLACLRQSAAWLVCDQRERIEGLARALLQRTTLSADEIAKRLAEYPAELPAGAPVGFCKSPPMIRTINEHH